MIATRGLSFGYRRSDTVFEGLDLTIGKGEFVALTGQNGAGKSTLLRLLTGLAKPRSGSVEIGGRRWRRIKPGDVSSVIGYAFQNPEHQLFESTVWRECMFTLRRQKVDEALAADRVEHVLRTVGLLDARDRHPATLSRGQKRRLAVATTLVNPIDVLLLDEPTTGQDFKTLEGLMGLMQSLNEDGTTVVMVTHDMDVVWDHASRVICMCRGQVLLDGPPREILVPANEHLLAEAQIALPLEAQLQALTAQER